MDDRDFFLIFITLIIHYFTDNFVVNDTFFSVFDISHKCGPVTPGSATRGRHLTTLCGLIWRVTSCFLGLFHALEAATQRSASLLVGSAVSSDFSFSCGSAAGDQLPLVLVPGLMAAEGPGLPTCVGNLAEEKV